jgi:DNA topoisomerase-1
MILILAEKPKVAEKIARFLGKNVKRIKEGQVVYYEFERDGEKIVVAPAVGHLFTVAEKKRTNTYPTLNITWVPIYEVNKKAEYTKQYLDVLKKLCSSAEQLICATDYDVEGSLIGYKIASFCFQKGNEFVRRMKFSAITPSDIENAYKSLESMDVENAMAGELRHELDWLYGINLSRALMSSLKQMGRFKVMSIGRVQGPALAILAKKEEEIKAFKPTPYWQVFAEAQGIVFKHKRERFLKEEEAKKAKEETKSPMKIIKCEKKEQTILAPPPFDLTTLQTEAYAAFGFSPSYTLQLAQTLYENSLISYPRTTSQKLPNTLPLKSIIQRLSTISQYSSFAKSILEHYKGPRQGKKEDPAHPAIHPTGIFAEMGKDEKKLYDLIVRRFLACFMPPTTRVNLVLEGNVNGQEYVFKNSFVKKEGWVLPYPFVNIGKEVELEIKKGQLLDVQKVWVEKKMTSPPKRFTQASIIKELEKRNLGTKATRAAIIDTLYTRGYIKGKKSLNFYKLIKKV